MPGTWKMLLKNEPTFHFPIVACNNGEFPGFLLESPGKIFKLLMIKLQPRPIESVSRRGWDTQASLFLKLPSVQPWSKPQAFISLFLKTETLVPGAFVVVMQTFETLVQQLSGPYLSLSLIAYSPASCPAPSPDTVNASLSCHSMSLTPPVICYPFPNPTATPHKGVHCTGRCLSWEQGGETTATIALEMASKAIRTAKTRLSCQYRQVTQRQ